MAKNRILEVVGKIEKELDATYNNAVKKENIPYNIGLFTFSVLMVREYLTKAGMNEEKVDAGLKHAMLFQVETYLKHTGIMLKDEDFKKDILGMKEEDKTFSILIEALLDANVEEGLEALKDLNFDIEFDTDKYENAKEQMFPKLDSPVTKTLLTSDVGFRGYRALFNLTGRFVNINNILSYIRGADVFGTDQALGVELLEKIEKRWKKHDLAGFFYDLENTDIDGAAETALASKIAFLIREMEYLINQEADKVMINAMFKHEACAKAFTDVSNETHVKSVKKQQKALEDAQYEESRGGGLNYTPLSVSSSTVNSSNQDNSSWSAWDVVGCIALAIGAAYVGRIAYNYATNSSFGVIDAFEYTNEEILSFVGLGHNEFV